MNKQEANFGPARRRFVGVLDTLFLLLLGLMLFFGLLIVVVQLVGLVVGGNAWLVTTLGHGHLTTAACVVGGLLGIVSLIQARAHGWKPSD